jgi:tripartite-type tricarboxylate transporter receptor subunit TctC
MKLPRRLFLHLAAGAAALPALSRIGRAQESQDYPTRPVRIIVGHPAGGTGYTHARLIRQKLSQQLSQPIIVEFRPGAGGNVAADMVAHAPPDGYTLLLFSSVSAINVTLYEKKTNFNFIRDIAPVAIIGRGPLVMEVNPSVPAKTVPEFIAYAKSNRGKLKMASAGTGGVTHLAGELFKMMAGVDMDHVPYRGSPTALFDLLGEKVQVMFDEIAWSIEHIQSGRLRALAVTTAMRSATKPELPSLGDFVPGYEASIWWGVGAPKNTPAEIVEKLNTEINIVLSDSTIKARLADTGETALSGSSDDFGKLIGQDVEKWGKVVKLAGIKAE